ncbi:glycosyltransferase family 4 protein [Pseudarthrobacter sp. SL88]|uniref:glycosyltransferase family 4 protein n=1 Tax=Pseudarthrobacter sp. SL88 TaxID=2994666 RepID=UPI002276F4CA|nr:glycosyltransferase family 4 protein [Pseudarthrobacter sp. SL88]MCY1673809.1 glycosyltransferase family 4 protein [Pseudarthrobacter sp. SL88]
MVKANIVYWYGLEDMPKDGGGLRALAWYEALTHLGFETQLCPLRDTPNAKSRDGWLRGIKKRLIPMPLKSSLPELPKSDINVVTVPSVFGSAASTVQPETLVFDWMDRWSVNSRTMGRASWMSRPGGLVQSLFWEVQERRLAGLPAVNVFAGYEDMIKAGGDSAPRYWIPTPITAVRSTRLKPTSTTMRVGFIANFAYPPNIMSLQDFFRRYGDSFHARGIEVVIAGFGSEIVRNWGVNAKVLGRVESLAEFYDSLDAALVPIDHGGGIKAKAVEAMAHGVPVFGTSHVASGFSPSWAAYIGEVEWLLEDSPRFPPVPVHADFEERFSQTAFNETVSDVLSQINRTGCQDKNKEL